MSQALISADWIRIRRDLFRLSDVGEVEEAFLLDAFDVARVGEHRDTFLDHVVDGLAGLVADRRET